MRAARASSIFSRFAARISMATLIKKNANHLRFHVLISLPQLLKLLRVPAGDVPDHHGRLSGARFVGAAFCGLCHAAVVWKVIAREAAISGTIIPSSWLENRISTKTATHGYQIFYWYNIIAHVY